MKYLNEITNEVYETKEEAEKSEQEALVKKQEADKLKEKKTNERKQFAKKIEDADAELDVAYDEYEKAKKETIALRRETDKKCEQILLEARRKLKAAQDKKYAVVADFNENFGPYTVQYTRDQAMKEMNRYFDSWMFPLFNW